MEFRPFVDFVNFVGWGLDISWDPSTLNKFDPCRVRPCCGLWSCPFVGSVHFVDLFKFFTLVGSVHVVDYGLDPSWGPSTLWTYLSFLPLSGPSTLWIAVLTLCGVRSLCGFFKVFYPCWVHPHCGLESWPLMVSVHFVDLFMFLTRVGVCSRCGL